MPRAVRRILNLDETRESPWYPSIPLMMSGKALWTVKRENTLTHRELEYLSNVPPEESYVYLFNIERHIFRRV